MFTWNGVSFINKELSGVVDVFTDASGTKGLGGVWGSKWFSSRVPHRYRNTLINFKELYAVLKVILCWGHLWSGQRVVFHVDNTNVHTALNKHMTHSPPLALLLRLVLMLTASLGFSLSSVWLSSADNAVADPASRFQYMRMFMVAPFLDKQLCSPNHLTTGMKLKLTSRAVPHSTCGTDSHPALGKPTIQARNPLSILFTSTPNTLTPTAPSFPPRKPPSSNGSPGLETGATSSLRQLKHISPLYNHYTSTQTYRSKLAKPLSCNTSSGASRATLAFAGFLRCSEFTVNGNAKFNPSIHLTRGSVVFKPSFEQPEFLILTLPSSKTDPFMLWSNVSFLFNYGAIHLVTTKLEQLK
ncbi:hypothetical protein CCMSSC00406_0010314 [Pleurotus cornucopiae]|uniref:Uncharacterized protein n=1 Tax=Pleurotus cornucopiae TaxID=5321 RepID=A0ACB7J0E9_PLECO|nr:hypothetical protein CCMSSC00406_0010314 [Pleurotus cornucopiae]